jgi:iron complex transport system ATP-binding protein
LNSLIINDLTIELNGKSIIDSFQLIAKTSEVVFLTGDNGAGKSTILKTIAGYIKTYAGEIFLDDIPKDSFSESQWHQAVHFLPQHNSLAFPIKVRDLLLMAFFRYKKWFDNYSSNQIQELELLAQQFGIIHLLDRNAKELSGGELQLCWLVQSFLAQPKVLLLDEPTQYLDAKNRMLFFNLLHDIQVRNPFICICVTHDLPFKKKDYGTIIDLS